MFDTLVKILDKTEDLRVALTGTYNLELQGVDIKSRDLDFVTDMTGIKKIARIFDSKITKSNFGSYETEFLVEDIEVHLITQDGNKLRQNQLENDLVYVEKNGINIPSVSLAAELNFYRECRRDKDEGKIELIKAAMSVSEPITKIVMFITRQHDGEREFFVLDRKDGTFVVPTGHVGDHVLGETLKDAAIRELKEELGVDPIKVTDLNHSYEVFLDFHQKYSDEHAFLLEIPDINVKFLENDFDWKWCSLDEAEEIMTYNTQKSALEKLKNVLKVL